MKRYIRSDNNTELHRYEISYLTTSDTAQSIEVEAADKTQAKRKAKRKIGKDFVRCIGITQLDQ